ncbi:PTS transporter subunit EIIB [Vibrio harveyi]|nr:PTS transporter subunit EIIB [Vibrio harveyi]
MIKKDLATPGRKGNELGLISKKDYQKLKTNQKQNAEQRIGDIIKTLGDKTNLESVSACATRLRVVVKDINLVNKEELNKLTNMGFIAKNNNVQVIFGGEATIISDKINEVLKQD